MKQIVLNQNEKYTNPIVLSLGFFDCIHLGHKALIQTANKLAKNIGAESFVLTFSNDPNAFFNSSKQIYSFADRAEIIETLGADGIISAEFDQAFADLSPKAFLDMILTSFNVKAVVSGADYTFGAHAQGNVDFLKDYFKDKGISVNVVPFECANGAKLSTRNLKSLVESGDVKTLNQYLSEPYFVTGDVKHAKQNGTRIGFPTANISQNADRLPLKDGVYATKTIIDGKEYVSMTNVGAKPTFNDFSSSVETYIIGFYGDLYGKTVKIAFYERMRDIQTFGSKEELREQLTRDEQFVKTHLKTTD
ncbi:MAG: riboflavin biosynthesis protein RibF [Clostridia bacterium]|nr:riboflavin biosynthesis protein RibF [Clostridia bacterium]